MRNMKTGRIAAMLLALMLAGSVTACGRNNSQEESGGTNASSSASEESQSGGDESTASNGEESGSEGKPENSKASGESSVSGEESGEASESSASGGESSASSGNNGSSKTENSKSESSQSSGNSKTENSKSENSKASSDSSTASSESSYVDEDSDLDEGDVEKPTKYIYLEGSSAKYDGDGITVNGSRIVISKGGHYELSGTLDNGQIYILTEQKKVKLMLNNCSITNSAGSAICCMRAKKVTLESLPGTTNNITDGGTHDADKGAVFSEDRVVLKGEGVINITGVYAHGIQSDDDIRINGGTVNITAAKSCLHSNDGIDINGGKLYCYGGTNGMKTDGYINVTGGESIFIGGEREDKGSIYCDGAFAVTGGTFYAIGNTMTTPDAATTTQNVIGFTLASSQNANTGVTVKSGSSTLFTISSPNPYKTVMYTSPNLAKNGSYSVTAGETVSGAKNCIGGTVSGGKDCGSFTASSTVAFFTVS